jgi:uncharacterized membrane protein YfcA
LARCTRRASAPWRKDFGALHRPAHAGARELAYATALGALIGFYDGFFGPGTGSFFVFLFVRLLGFDFLHASASAKLLNTATNASAVTLFASTGHVWWGIAALLAVANIGGSVAGTALALRGGSALVRRVFVVVVAALIARTTWDAFGG